MWEGFKRKENMSDEEDKREESEGSDKESGSYGENETDEEDGSGDEDESEEVDGSDDEDESEEVDGSNDEDESEEVDGSDDEDESEEVDGSDDEDESEEVDGSDDEDESEEVDGSEDEDESEEVDGSDDEEESEEEEEEVEENINYGSEGKGKDDVKYEDLEPLDKFAERINMDVDYEEEELVVHTLKPGLEFVPRTTWRAKEPTHKWPLKNPVKAVRMTKTRGLPCDSLTRCCRRLRRIQENHIKYHDLADIAYNFMIGGDGRIYEGRGWETEGILVQGEQYLSDKAIAFAHIGNYNKRNPLPPQLEFQVDKFLDYAVEIGKIHPRAIKFEYNEVYDGGFPDENFKEEEEKIPHMKEIDYDNYEFKTVEEEAAYLETIRPSDSF